MESWFKTCCICILLVFSFVTPTYSCFIEIHWRIFITNTITDNIVAHVQSGDDDLGNHTIPFNTNYSWEFCRRMDRRTLYFGSFWWGSKFQTFDLYNKDIDRFYHTSDARDDNCYWLVRPDGFWISRRNLAFPDSWNIMRSWTN